MSIYLSSLAGRRAGFLRLIVAVVATLVLILGLIPAVAQAQNSEGEGPDVPVSEDDSTTDEGIIDDTVTDPDATALDATPGTDPEGLAEDINEMIMPLQQVTGPVVIDGIRINSAVIPVRQWSQVKVVWDWSAPNGVKNGDTFTVTFPDELNVNHAETFNLLDENDVVGGECVAVRGTGADAEAGTEKVPGYVTCKFNSNFENVDDVRGTVTVGSNAWETTTASDVTFVGDGDRDISVDLPGEEGILPEIIRTDIEVDKHGWYDGDSKTGTWELMIPGTALEGLDGDLEITDTLSGYSHVFLDRNPLGTVWTYNGTNGSIVLDETVAWFTPTIAIAEGGQELTMTVAMPADGWNPDHLYRIRYFTETADGEVAPYYEETTNKAVVNGKEVDRTISRKPYGSGTISGVDRGSFELAKRLDATGDVRARISAGTMFTVRATYEKDGAAQTETIQVPLDGSAAGNESLPAGTVVTLTEINLPEIPGVTFGAPRFSATNDNDENVEISADGRTATVTIIESDNVAVTLTNTADVATGEFLVTKELGGLTGSSARDDEFELQATWTIDGVEETREFTVRAGETYTDFPDLPVGTEVTLSETAPSNTLVARWNTPAFSSNTPDAVVDNDDGTATLTIQPDSVDEATLVTVTNSANPPWWWILVPLIPIIGSSAGSSEGSSAAGSSGSPEGSSGSSTGTPDTPGTPDQPGQPDTPGTPGTPGTPDAPEKGEQPGVDKQEQGKQEQPQAQPQRTLAQTGASVLGLIALALTLGVAGVFLIRRGRA